MKEVKVIKANTNIIHRGKGRELGVLLRVAAYCRVSTDDVLWQSDRLQL